MASKSKVEKDNKAWDCNRDPDAKYECMKFIYFSHVESFLNFVVIGNIVDLDQGVVVGDNKGVTMCFRGVMQREQVL